MMVMMVMGQPNIGPLGLGIISMEKSWAILRCQKSHIFKAAKVRSGLNAAMKKMMKKCTDCLAKNVNHHGIPWVFNVKPTNEWISAGRPPVEMPFMDLYGWCPADSQFRFLPSSAGLQEKTQNDYSKHVQPHFWWIYRLGSQSSTLWKSSEIAPDLCCHLEDSLRDRVAWEFVSCATMCFQKGKNLSPLDHWMPSVWSTIHGTPKKKRATKGRNRLSASCLPWSAHPWVYWKYQDLSLVSDVGCPPEPDWNTANVLKKTAIPAIPCIVFQPLKTGEPRKFSSNGGVCKERKVC